MAKRSILDRPEATPRGSARVGPTHSALLRLLYDQVTELPTLPLFFRHIRESLRNRNVLGLMTISIVQRDAFEQLVGWEGFENVIRDLGKFLLDIKPMILRRDDLVSEVMISGNAFVILLAPPRERYVVRYEDMDKIRTRIRKPMRTFLNERLPVVFSDHLDFGIGCATLEAESGSPRLERVVYNALDAAFADSLLQQKREESRDARQLWELLRHKLVSSVFQPVVDLGGRRIVGYEALSRGRLPGFERPDHFFRVAYENRAIWSLERICREKALAGLGSLSKDQLLFLNIEPESIYDPELQGETMQRLISGCGLETERIVLELTEHAAVKDFTLFRQSLRKIQGEGYQLAIDDVGSAYSGLRSIAELRPDFMKIDMSLIHGVHENEIKRELLATILKFARKTGIGMIAEGIEEKKDLETIQQIGIPFAQGFLLARPQPGLPPVDFQDLFG